MDFYSRYSVAGVTVSHYIIIIMLSAELEIATKSPIKTHATVSHLHVESIRYQLNDLVHTKNYMYIHEISQMHSHIKSSRNNK